MSATRDRSVQLKVIVTGPKYSGKSSIIQRLIQGEDFSTANTDDILRTAKETSQVPITVEGQKVLLEIWDDVEPLISVSGMHSPILGAIFVFDASDYAALDGLAGFVSQKTDIFRKYNVNLKESVFFLALSKADGVGETERQNLIGRVDAIALNHLMFTTHFFVDSETGEGVQSMFETLAKVLLEGRLSPRNTGYHHSVEKSGVIRLDETREEPRKKACCN